MKKHSEICAEIKVEPPNHKIQQTNVKYITKILFKKEVYQITNMLIINNRIGTKIYLRDRHTPKSKAALIRHIALYNTLPIDIKTLNLSRMKWKLKKLHVTFELKLNTHMGHLFKTKHNVSFQLTSWMDALNKIGSKITHLHFIGFILSINCV